MRLMDVRTAGDAALVLGGGHVIGADEEEELHETEHGGRLERLDEVLGGEGVVPLVQLLHQHAHHRKHGHAACSFAGVKEWGMGSLSDRCVWTKVRGWHGWLMDHPSSIIHRHHPPTPKAATRAINERTVLELSHAELGEVALVRELERVEACVVCACRRAVELD